MERQKNVRRTIILKTPSNNNYLSIDQTVTFIKVDNKYLPTSEPEWEEYQAPKIDNLKADQTTISAQKVSADTKNQTIIIEYHSKQDQTSQIKDATKEQEAVNHAKDTSKDHSVLERTSEDVKNNGAHVVKDEDKVISELTDEVNKLSVKSNFKEQRSLKPQKKSHKEEKIKYKRCIPLDASLAYLETIPEVKEKTKQLKLVGNIELVDNQWKGYFYPENNIL